MVRMTAYLGLGGALVAFTLGCGSISKVGKSSYKNSALGNFHAAPDSMSPPHMDPNSSQTVDNLHVESKADFHFTMGEALSMEGNSKRAIEEFKLVLVYDSESSLVRLRLAAEYIRQGLMSEAIEQAEIAVEKDPKSDDARLLLGGLYSSVKMYDKALEQYQQLREMNPENLEAPIYIGAILAEQKRYEEAIGYFQKLGKNKRSQQRHKAYYYIGRIHMEKDREAGFKKSEKAFLRALNLKPDYVEAVLALGALYQTNSRQKTAVSLLMSFQDKFGPDRHVAKELSQIFLEKEEYDKAFEQLEIIEGYERDNLNIKVQMALILIEKKKWNRAVVILEDILAQAPESDRIRFYLAAVYEELSRPRLAIKNYQLIPSSSVYYPEAVLHVAYLYKSIGDYPSAIAAVKEGSEVRPDVPQFFAFYASLLDDQKRYTQAVTMLEAAVQKFPTHAQLQFFLGSMYDRVGDKQSTVKKMQTVLEIDENHVQALNYLAYTYAELNQNLDRAEELARKALSLQPEDGYILDTIGWILFKRGDVEDSIQYLERAHRVKSDESIIAEHLGDAYFRFQLMGKAKRMYLKAVEVESDVQKAQQIKNKIIAIDEQVQPKPGRVPASVPKKNTPSH